MTPIEQEQLMERLEDLEERVRLLEINLNTEDEALPYYDIDDDELDLGDILE